MSADVFIVLIILLKIRGDYNAEMDILPSVAVLMRGRGTLTFNQAYSSLVKNSA